MGLVDRLVDRILKHSPAPGTPKQTLQLIAIEEFPAGRAQRSLPYPAPSPDDGQGARVTIIA